MEPASLAAAVHAALLARGQTVGCAESLTGGELAALLSRTPGASGTFVGGVVSYATAIKREVLGVTASQVVSADCAIEMATGVRKLLGTDWSIATTGVAGPDQQEGKAVGTVYVAIAGPSGARAHRFSLDGDRRRIRGSTCVAALEGLLDELG